MNLYDIWPVESDFYHLAYLHSISSNVSEAKSLGYNSHTLFSSLGFRGKNSVIFRRQFLLKQWGRKGRVGGK